MSQYQTQVRLMRELIQIDRRDLEQARTVIGRMEDPRRREALESALERAEATLDSATASWHSFTFDSALDPLALAGRQI